MSHGDTIIDGNGIELSSKIASLLEDLLHLLSDMVQVGMTGNKLGERVGNAKNRFPKLTLFHPVGTPEAPCSRHSASHGTRIAAVLDLHCSDTLFISKKNHPQS